jgi:hypothetical protein
MFNESAIFLPYYALWLRRKASCREVSLTGHREWLVIPHSMRNPIFKSFFIQILLYDVLFWPM